MIVFACLLAMSATVLAAPTSTMMQMSIADGPTPKPLLMKDTQMLLTTDYPKEEKGFTSNSDGTYLVAGDYLHIDHPSALTDYCHSKHSQ